jgi:hypothetical protein
MRLFLSILLIICTVENSSAATKVPKKLLGEYHCIIPSREIQYNGGVTAVAPAKVILYVYRFRMDIKIDDKLFVGYELHSQKSSRKNPMFQVSFESPFGEIVVRFNRKGKTASFDSDILKDLVFQKK